MKPEHREYQQELIAQVRSLYLNGDSLSDASLVRGQCYEFCKKFVERFPNLVMIPGFYNGNEHWWCQDPETGEIVDPTVEQFLDDGQGEYSPHCEGKYRARVGKCVNCGVVLLEGDTMVSAEMCSDSCANSFVAYLNSELTRCAVTGNPTEDLADSGYFDDWDDDIPF